MKRKILTVVEIVIICIMIFSVNVYASVVDTNINIDKSNINQFDNFGSTIISTIRIVGMIISVGALMVIGIRYMVSSVEEKAEQKQSLINYCIGAVLLFAIVNIVSAIYNWASTL